MFVKKDLDYPINVKIFYSPEKITTSTNSIFLSGSIEMGKAENWQAEFMRKCTFFPVTIFNPRRDDWDSSWKQDIENPQFREQVEWELNAMDKANVIAMYFSPKTKSPITLLELGLYSCSKKLIVCCPSGFWRKGNVDIVCKRYGIEKVDSLSKLIDAALDKVHYGKI